MMPTVYLPLYRKYRPQCFADLVGQNAIRQTLTNAIELGRVAHAYLFCGPRGTGKTSTARIFAKSLNCEQGPTATPCQICASCTGITQGQALDVIEFDAASNNGVEDARELIESCQFAPMAGRYKVYIIDEVHMLSTQAFNTLLKTLEEPPPNVVFLFATTEAHKVLPTIISRCQRFDFSRIHDADMTTHLAYIAQLEHIDLTTDALTLVARSSKGGLRDALSLLDQVSVIFQGSTVSAASVRQLLGSMGPEALYELTQAIAQADVAALMQTLAQLTRDGVEAPQMVRELTAHWRDLMLYASAPAAIDASDAETGRYAEQAAWFRPEDYPILLNRLAELDRQLKQSSQTQLWLEVGLVGLAYRDSLQQVGRLSERLDVLEARLTQGIVRPANPPVSQQTTIAAKPIPLKVMAPVTSTSQEGSDSLSTSAVPASQQLDPTAAETALAADPLVHPVSAAVSPLTDDYRLLWQTLCDRVGSPPTKSLLKQHTFLKQMTEDRLIIGCSSDPTLQLLKRPDKLAHVQRAITQHFGAERHIDFVLDKPPTSMVSAASPVVAASPTLPQAQLSAMLPRAVISTVSAVTQAASEAEPSRNAESARHQLVAQASGSDEPPPLEDLPDSSTAEISALATPGVINATAAPADIPPTEAPVDAGDLEASRQYVMDLLQAKPI